MVMGKGKGKLVQTEEGGPSNGPGNGASEGPGNGPLPLPSLPEGLLEIILVKASNCSLQNMCKLLCTCKKVKTFLESDYFYKSIDLMFMYRPPRMTFNSFAFYRNVIPPQWLELKLKCYSKRNPSALLLRGMYEFMTGGNPQVGIDDIRESEESGFEMGKYCYGVIRNVLWIDGIDSGPVLPITREFCVAMRLSLRRYDTDEWKWHSHQHMSNSFRQRLDDLFGAMSYLRNKKKGCWCGAHLMSVEERKWSPHRLCDRCFWNLEGWSFFYHAQDYFPFWV